MTSNNIMTRRVFAGGVAAAALMPATKLLAASGPLIRFAVADRAAPISYRNDNGEIAGIEPDLVGLVASAAGLRVTIDAYPWTRAQMMVQEGSADALCSLATEARQQRILFAPEPLFSLNAGRIHFSPDNPRRAELARLASLDDLRDFRIVGVIGDSWPNSLFAGWPNFQEVRDVVASLKLVTSLRADLVLDSREILTFYQKRYGLPAFETIDASFLSGCVSLYRFGIRRSFDQVETLIAQFATAQAKAQASGAIAEALKPYLA